MKKLTKVLATVLAIACAGMVFAGCGTKTGETSKTETKEKLVMATNAEFPPFEYVTEKGIVGKFDGIDVAIMKEVAKNLNMDLEIDDMKFTSILSSVASGKADIGVAGMTVEPERKDSVDFTDTYWVAMQTILVKKDNTDITSVDSLKGKKVGVITGYTGDTSLTDAKVDTQMTVKRYNKGVDAVEELKNGKLDAVIIDSPTAESFVKQNSSAIKGVEDANFFKKEEYAMAVKKGNKDLLDKVNAEIKKMKQSGRITEIANEVNERLAASEDAK